MGGAITSNYWAVAQILLYVDVDACTMQFGLSERSGGLWHTVVVLPLALRQRTRTLLGFQGTTDIFSHKERKAEMQGFKPQSPQHWVLRPVACGGLKPEYCHNCFLVKVKDLCLIKLICNTLIFFCTATLCAYYCTLLV